MGNDRNVHDEMAYNRVENAIIVGQNKTMSLKN